MTMKQRSRFEHRQRLAGRRLTPPELEYLLGVSRGWTALRISHEVQRAEQTIRSSLSRAYRRLGAQNGVEAVLKAVFLGYFALNARGECEVVPGGPSEARLFEYRQSLGED